jgi:hypothetical protein
VDPQAGPFDYHLGRLLASVRCVPRLADLLDPRPVSPPLVVRPEHVGGRAAWEALVRDGALVVLRGTAAVRADLPVGPGLRAGVLRGGLPRGAAVAGRTAAWVHAGVPDGGTLDLAYASGRHRPEVWAGARVWQEALLASDVTEIAGVRVTTPVRTVVDLALRDDAERALEAVRALVETCGVDLRAAARVLESRARVVGRPRARRVLTAAQETLVP